MATRGRSSVTGATERVESPVTWRLATVSGLIRETPRAKTIVLDVPGWPGHIAGHHVDVRLAAEDGYQVSRSYSIAAAPEHDRHRGLAPLMLLSRKGRAGEYWIQGGAG
jgi:hypothetical protein